MLRPPRSDVHEDTGRRRRLPGVAPMPLGRGSARRPSLRRRGTAPAEWPSQWSRGRHLRRRAPSPRWGWMPGDRVQRNRKRVGQHCDLVADGVGKGKQHRLMGRQIFSETTRGIPRGPRVNAGGEGALGEVPTQAEVAFAARATRGVDSAWSTREPRVQHHPLADLQLRDPGPSSATSATTSWPRTVER